MPLPSTSVGGVKLSFTELFTILTAAAVVVQGLTPPRNTAVVVSSNATFSCSSNTSRTIRWDYYQYGSKQPLTVYNGDKPGLNLDVRFVVDVNQCHTERTCSVTVVDVRLTDAGYFVCFESGAALRYTASLTVLGAEPNCSTNLIEPDHSVHVDDEFEIGCWVNFTGNWTPVIVCTPDLDDKDGNVVHRNVSPHRVTFSKSIQGHSVVDGTDYVCTTSFHQRVPPTTSVPQSTDSNNIPSYSFQWTSRPVRVVGRTIIEPTSTDALPVSTTTPTSSTTIVKQGREVLDNRSRTVPVLGPAASVQIDSPATPENPYPTISVSVPLNTIIVVSLSLVGLLFISIIIIVILVVVVINRRRRKGRSRALPAPPHPLASSQLSGGGGWGPAGTCGTMTSLLASSHASSYADERPYSVIREVRNYPTMSSHNSQCGVGAAGSISNPRHCQGNSSSWCSEDQTYIEVDPAALACYGLSKAPVAGGSGVRYTAATSRSDYPPLRYEPLNADTVDGRVVSGHYSRLRIVDGPVEIQQQYNGGSDVTAGNKVVETNMKRAIGLCVTDNSDYLKASVQLQQQKDEYVADDKMAVAAGVLQTRTTTTVEPVGADPRTTLE